MPSSNLPGRETVQLLDNALQKLKEKPPTRPGHNEIPAKADSMDLFLTDIESDNEVPNVKDCFPVVQEDSCAIVGMPRGIYISPNPDTELDNEVPEATAVPEVNAISEIKTETVSRYVDAIIERHAMQPGAKIYHPPPEAKFNRNRNVDGRLSVPASPVAADENPIQVTDIELDSTTCGSNFDPPVVFKHSCSSDGIRSRRPDLRKQA
ncbi:hypothetical protein GALMADRAFT_208970 [Galerina marginata CBS 339.88]|uniref:Uncharacterized protein n=1 Tax=Galerina marginata (strain CBS 339.88) TaxID=685588 RepID=A0A067T905_GALM3|nr:hypothetical protein GALMADRAFT_208970 [Galerina marginata CBS 339.88]